ncbi:MAG: dihydrodipicolinate synthase family protein [Pseudomonadota bacterium]
MNDQEKPTPHGIYAIVYALFDASEKLDRSLMRRQVEICLASGVHGMAALGLATEVSKLGERERVTVMDWVAEDTGRHVPLALTIYGNSVAEQIRQVRHAETVGASWIILQPPNVGRYSGKELIDFFCRVAEATALPVAIQNAPAFLGTGLSADEIIALGQRCPNFRLIKAEGSAVDIAGLIETTGRKLPVFNGRAGLELIDNLQAGCSGFILAPDCIDHAVRAYELFREAKIEEAAATYRTIAPSIVFAMQGIEHLICYGKRIFGARAGIEIIDRAPALRPSGAGLAFVSQFAADLGAFPQGARG